MQHVLKIDCPPELLLSLHQNAEQLAEWIKLQGAITLYKEGKISSGLAANWVGISRIDFLQRAMQAGAVLLDDSEDDYQRETALL